MKRLFSMRIFASDCNLLKMQLNYIHICFSFAYSVMTMTNYQKVHYEKLSNTGGGTQRLGEARASPKSGL